MKYNILSLHKCGTVFQDKIFSYIAQKLNYNYYKSGATTNESNKISPCITTFRTINTLPNSIIIPRHPLNRLISKYYSDGWSHTTNFKWISNQEIKKQKEAEYLEKRLKIQKQTLDEFVKENIYDRAKEYKILLTTNELVIPYELMMNKPYEFFEKVCCKLEIPNLASELYDTFKNEFDFTNKDYSKDIITNTIKVHKRTLNNKEYKEKLNEFTLTFAKENLNNILDYYNNLLKQCSII